MASEPTPSSAPYQGTDTTTSASTLLSRLLDDATALVRNELALAKAELLGAANTMKAGLVSMSLGIAVLVTGVLTLVAAAVLGLSEVIDPWLAALLIGIVLAIAGLVMIRMSKRKLTGLDVRLDATRESLRKDAAVAARRT